MEEILIDLVRENKCLWNPADSNYANKHFKDRVWMEIAQQIPCSSGKTVTAEFVKKKWKSLKDGRASNRRKEKGRSGQANSFHRPYKYAQLMSFLDGVDEETESAPTSSSVLFGLPSIEINVPRIDTESSDLSTENILRFNDQEHTYYNNLPQAEKETWEILQSPVVLSPPRVPSPPPVQSPPPDPSPPHVPSPTPPVLPPLLHSPIPQHRVAIQNKVKSSAINRKATQQKRRNEQRQRIIEAHRETGQGPATPPPQQPETPRPASRRRGETIDAVGEAILQELQRNPEDEHTHFCLSLAPVFRSLSPQVASNLRIKILRMIHEARFPE